MWAKLRESSMHQGASHATLPTYFPAIQYRMISLWFSLSLSLSFLPPSPFSLHFSLSSLYFSFSSLRFSLSSLRFSLLLYHFSKIDVMEVQKMFKNTRLTRPAPQKSSDKGPPYMTSTFSPLTFSLSEISWEPPPPPGPLPLFHPHCRH